MPIKLFSSRENHQYPWGYAVSIRKIISTYEVYHQYPSGYPVPVSEFNWMKKGTVGMLHGTNQGLERNWISWSTAIRCNNNNGRFIFNRTQTHHSTISDLQPDVEFDHVVYKINVSQIFWLLMKICLKGISINNIFQKLYEWWQLVTTRVHQTNK